LSGRVATRRVVQHVRTVRGHARAMCRLYHAHRTVVLQSD
jgi:hypothetical protein